MAEPKPLDTGLMECLYAHCYPESDWRELYESARFTLATLDATRERLKEAERLLENLSVWAEWQEQRRRDMRMNEPNTGAAAEARAFLKEKP